MRKMRKLAFGFAAVMVVLLAFGLLTSTRLKLAAGQPNESGDKYQINIDNFSFTPAILTVPVGAKVTWTNKDDVPHTVVSTTKAFPHSPALDTDQSFSYVFAKAGTYEYYCSVHPKMVGKVVVQ
jgi:plastocyanin